MGLQRARRAKPVAEPLAALTMAAWGGEPGHGSPIGGTREPRGRFLTLQPAQDGFKPLEIAVTHGFVTMFSGWLLMSPHVRMNCVMRSKMGLIGTDSVPLDMLAQASWRANRRTRRRGVTGGKIRCYSGLCALLRRRVRRPKRIAVIIGRMPFRASTLVCSLWCVRRAR